jgi:hypothetical protein
VWKTQGNPRKNHGKCGKMLENDGLIGNWNKKNDTNEFWRCWNWDFSQKYDGFEAWTKPRSGKIHVG